MKKCVVCSIKLEDDSGICNTCLEFITWKYESDAQDEIQKFRESEEYLEKWRSQSEKEVEE